MAFGFSEKGAKRIVDAVRHIERTPKTRRRAASRRSVITSNGLWAEIGIATGAKYSWTALEPQSDGTLATNADWGSGDSANATGFAVEANGDSTVQSGTRVLLRAAPGQDYWIFDQSCLLYIEDDTCQLCQCYNGSAYFAGASPSPIILDTVQVDAGDICDVDSATGHVRIKFTGNCEISYVVAGQRNAGTGGDVTWNTWVEHSTNNGSSWSTVTASTIGSAAVPTTNAIGAATHPCVYLSSTAGDLVRLVRDGVGGSGATCDFYVGGSVFKVKPCGQVTPINEEDSLIVRWVPRDPPDNPEFPIVPPPDNPDYPDLGLTNNGSITATTGDENPNAWDFNGTNQYFSNATGDWLDWSEDFTYRVHFSVDTVGAFNSGTLIFMNDGATTSNPFGLRVVDASPPHRLMLDVGITVAIVTGISPSTWYSAYVRYDASTGQFDLDVVGVGNDNDIPSYSPVASPTINIGAAAFFNDDYLDGQIDSLRFWSRRLADWEFV